MLKEHKYRKGRGAAASQELAARLKYLEELKILSYYFHHFKEINLTAPQFKIS